MRVIDRLQQFLQEKNITPHSFERTIKVANGYFKKQLKGRGSVGSNILQRVIESYPELNCEWLITGNGLMLR